MPACLKSPPVKSKGMPATAAPNKGRRGGVEVFRVKRHQLGVQAAQKSEKQRTGILAEPGGQYDYGL